MTPVGTIRNSSRSEMCAGCSAIGATASSDSATGVTASAMRIAATQKPVMTSGSKIARPNSPTPYATVVMSE